MYTLEEIIRYDSPQNLLALSGKLDLYGKVIRLITRKNKRLHKDRKRIKQMHKNTKRIKIMMSFLTGFI